MQLSFVIPAYNASTTIVRCLNSICSLPLNECDFEIICIDDCSNDNTIAIIEEYAKLHSNIKLLCQEVNQRQGAARNRGVSIARGKYIMFVDSDDEIDKGVLDALQLAEDNNLDMVAMHYVNVDEKGNISEKEPVTIDGVFSGIAMQEKHPYWGSAPWPYFFKNSFLKNAEYPFAEGVLYEDSDFVAVHLYHAKRMMYSEICSYRMHYNAYSTTHTMSYKHVSDYYILGTRMLKFYESLPDASSKFAKIILEGASYNIYKSCSRLFKLSSIQEVKNFYCRIDSYSSRAKIYEYKDILFYWNTWFYLCIKHKYITIALTSLGIITYKLKKIIAKL